MEELSAEEYLKLFEISKHKYLIGIFQDGITIYKQQIRALNIFYALLQTGKIKPGEDFRIGIIGGGVAGLTFAAAALKSNIKVAIIEKEQYYLHMQYGCEIRKVHPNIYEWPDQGSNFPNTELPVLNWKFDTAANVAIQLLNGFYNIKDGLKNTTDIPADYLRQQFSCKKVAAIKKSKEQPDYNFLLKNDFIKEGQPPKDQFYIGCDILIFAIGYGIEKGLDNSKDACSYWRNDAIGQSFFGSDKLFFISGIGDGGLMDLLRIAIHNFNYDYILNVIESDPAFPNLLKMLRRIKKRGLESKFSPKKLFYEFAKIPSESYNYIYDTLRSHRRLRENRIILNSTAMEFHDSLDFTKVSILNSFLCFVLYQNSAFEYYGGYFDYAKDEQKYYLSKILLPPKYQNAETMYYIIRNGTDRQVVFKDLPLTDGEKSKIEMLKLEQEKTFNHGQLKPMWTVGELNLLFNKNRLLDYPELSQNSSISSSRRIEYYTSETSAICSNLLSIVRSIIIKYKSNAHPFRVSIHRIVSLQNECFFQQITPYFTEAGTKGIVGEVFPISRGNVGLSIASGQAIKIVNDGPDFDALVEELNLESEFKKLKKSKSFLTLPINSRIKNATGELAANLVIFCDAGPVDFYDNQEMIENIIASAQGFLNHIQMMIQDKQILMRGIDFNPIPVNPDAISERVLSNSCFFNLSKSQLNLSDKLVLNEFYSFDIVYNSNISEPNSFI